MRIVDVLDYRFPGRELVGVWHMMEEEQQFIRRGCERLIHLCHFGTVLCGVARAGSDAAIHAYAVVIGAMPLPPSIALRRLYARPVMRSGDVRQCSGAERSGVVFVDAP